MGKRKRVIILSLFFILSTGLFASSQGFCDHFYGTRQIKNISLSYFPDIYLGTHGKGIGINGNLTAWGHFGVSGSGIGIAAELDVNGTAYLSNFGMPGRSALLETGGKMMVGLGKPSEFGDSKWLRTSPYRHTLAKRYTYYFATDGTSQPYAHYSYELNIGNKYFIFRIGNDAYAIKRDGFRSSAGDLTVYINKMNYLLGVSLGFKLWHGDYSEQCYLNPGQVYDFSHIVGGDYTLGLIYASFSYNCFGIKIGYDSDKIRVTLQNMVHRAMKNGLVPDVDRSDRLFIELSLFGNSGQY